MAVKTDSLQVKCPTCSVSISTKYISKHKIIHYPTCGTCCLRFKTIEKHRVHQKAIGQCYCRQCKTDFLNVTEHALHVRKKPHHEQYRCCDCEREYPDPGCLKRHCCVCDQVFKSKNLFKKHVTSNESHGNQTHFSRGFWCYECKKEFKDLHTLDQHASSKKVKPLRIIPCPMNSGCCKKFATPSALFNHLESAGCKSGMDRQKLNQLVTHHDKDYYITCESSAREFDSFFLESFLPSPDLDPINQKIATYHRGESILTPPSESVDDAELVSSHQAQLTPDIDDIDFIGGVLVSSPARESASSWSMLPTPQAWDLESATDHDISTPLSPSHLSLPQQLHCPLCPRSFGSNTALQTHIISAAHAPKSFHCPVAFTPATPSKPSHRRREKLFSTLSGLTRHLEAGACRGGMATFRNAISFVEEQLRSCGLGCVKLLVGGNRSVCSHEGDRNETAAEDQSILSLS